MEWVETTGRTVEDAKDAALDQLGVDEQDAEFEILEEPRTGLFGRVRGEARVRARVKPRQPRAKAERGNRRRRDGGGGKGGGRGRGGRNRSGGGAKGGGDREDADATPATAPAAQADDAPVEAAVATLTEEPAAPGAGGDRTGGSGRNRGSRGGRNRNRKPAGDGAGTNRSTEQDAPTGGDATTKEQAMTEDVTVQEQAEIIEGFLEGLVDAFGVEASIRRDQVDDETIELDLAGDDLGLLIGPKGRTLWAIQELSRTVVQRQATGTHHGRVRIDVGGYRQRRKEALVRFTRQLAAEVQESGVARSLEPMGAADRKIVHDTVNEMDGIATTSEGEEPRRRVVIVPAD